MLQVEEKFRFAELLADLCSGIPELPQTFGRPRLPPSDVFFVPLFRQVAGVNGMIAYPIAYARN